MCFDGLPLCSPRCPAVISLSVPETLFPLSLGSEEWQQADPEAKPKLVWLHIWRKWAASPLELQAVSRSGVLGWVALPRGS